MFSLTGYAYDDRLSVKKYCLLAKHITKNRVNNYFSYRDDGCFLSLE